MKNVLPWLFTPLFGVMFAITSAVAILLCTLPMTQVIGFEYSFIMGIVIPLAAGHIAALCPAQMQMHTGRRAPLPWRRTVANAVLPPAVLLITALVIIFANQLFVPPCNNTQGLAFFLILPGVSTVLAIIAGFALGILFSKKIVAVAAWYLLWILFAIVSLVEAYQTPAVFSFGPFFGYWPGVWYDRQIAVTDALISYRIFNLLIGGTGLLIIKIFGANGGRDNRQRFQLRRISLKDAVPLSLCVLAVSVFFAKGEALGHRTSTNGLKSALPHHVRGEGIDIYFDAHIAGKTRKDIANDAQFGLYQLRRYFDIKSHPPITVFVFKTAEQKHRLMGARHTSVAKPWLGQTYIVAQKSPHWTLRHELAHLVAAEFGSGPFRISAGKSGVVPVPALLEGVAVAATPTHGSLSLHQSAAAMKKLNLLPRVQALMGLDFLRIFSRRAYTAAGSFCMFIRDRFGARSLRRMYSGESAVEATGHSLNRLESLWQAHLGKIRVPKKEMENISYLLDRPALVESKCGREVSRLKNEADQAWGAEQPYDALQKLTVAHRVSGNATETDLALFFAEAKCNHRNAAPHGRSLLAQNPGMNRTLQVSEALADMQIEKVPLRRLAAQYKALLAFTTAENDARRIYLKQHFALRDSPAAKTLLQYLSTTADANRPGSVAAIYALRQMQQAHPRDPLVSYLTARILFMENEWYHAVSEMKRAFNQALETVAPTFVVEAKFTLGRALLRLKQFESAQEQFRQIQAQTTSQDGYVELAKDWYQRVEWQARHDSKL